MTFNESMIRKTRIKHTDFEKSVTGIWNDSAMMRIYAEDIIKCGICPLFTELGLDCEHIKERIENAKNAKMMNEADFIKYSSDSNTKELNISSNPDDFKNAEGKAILKCIIEGGDDNGFYPVINQEVVVQKEKGLHILIHEMMHVLANPDFVKKIRKDGESITNNDEGVNEYFARLVSINYFENPNSLYKEEIGDIYEIYSDRFVKKTTLIPQISIIGVEETKHLAKLYFG